MDNTEKMNVKITSAVSQLPEYSKTTAEVIPFVEAWLANEDQRFRRKVVKLFEGAAVDQRYSIMNPEEVFTATSFEDKNKIYEREAKSLGKKVLQKALDDSHWEAESIDYIITVSCTGIMIPSIDAFLINKLNMKQDIVRLPVTEMGCVAGVSGMIYANNFLKANPNKRAVVIAVESPTSTFQLEDYSMTNIVSAAIFGDGCACTILSSYEHEQGPEIIDEAMYHFYNAEQMMGFEIKNTGLQMVLDKEVPEKIASHFPKIVHPFIERNNLTIEDVDHLIFHPGGKKIVQTIEELFGVLGKNIDNTKAVLKEYGNMSSATVLYVLERFMEQEPQQGEIGLMLSFGPGFTAQQILLKW
jgi:predicted naringenin-chalcone synthase